MTSITAPTLHELRAQEVELRHKIVAEMARFHAGRLWAKQDCTSMRDFCERKLGYEPSIARQLLIAAGVVLTQAQLVSEDPEIQRRLQSLLQWRADKAALERKAPFRYFSNRTLLLIAQENPTTRAQLADIYGMGDRRVAEFGDAIFECLQNKQMTMNSAPPANEISVALR